MTGWALEALVASALLMAVVLLVRAPARRLFGPQLAYALWSLPLLRLLMPPLPASWREQAALPIAQAGEVMTVLVGPDVAPATTAVAAEPVVALPWGGIVVGAWLLGAALFFGLHFVRHRRFCRRLLAQARVLDRIDGVRVIETPAASGPLAFGMAHRFVAFPHDFTERYDADERELALAHELGHHARSDLIANWAALAVLAFHWFNPLAWHAFRAFRCDQELANDARVLAGRSRMDRHIYACAIVKAAHGGAISAACHLHTITDLKGRLRMLSNARLSRTRLATGVAAIVGAVTGGLLVTASGTQAAAALTERVESATGVQIAAPPVPPAPAVRAVPAVPAVPPVPATTTRSARHVVIVKDGKTTRYDGDAAAAYIAAHPVPVSPVPPVPPMPGVVVDIPVTASVTTFTSDGRPTIVDSGDCQPATGAATIVRKDRDGRRMTIVCRNRIATIAASAQREAERGRRQAEVAMRRADLAAARAEAASRPGLQQAIASIRLARQTIENDRNLSGGERREALAGLDDAMREVREHLRD